MTNLGSILKSKDITLPAKVHIVKAMLFYSGHVWLWMLDYKEGWVPKNWCFQIVVLEKTLESPLDFKKIKPVNLEINPEYSLEGLMLKLKVQYFGHLMQNADSLEKYPDAWKDWRQQEKGITEVEFAQTLGNSEGQGSLACCSSWNRRKTGLRNGTTITIFGNLV